MRWRNGRSKTRGRPREKKTNFSVCLSFRQRKRMGRLLRVAAACRRAIRKKPAVRITVAVSLVALGACLPFLSLMATRTSSFEEALSTCEENGRATATKYRDATASLEFHKSNAANSGSWFTLVFKTVSSWFSLACFLLWMFFTPHTSSSETRLDIQRASPS